MTVVAMLIRESLTQCSAFLIISQVSHLGTTGSYRNSSVPGGCQGTNLLLQHIDESNATWGPVGWADLLLLTPQSVLISRGHIGAPHLDLLLVAFALKTNRDSSPEFRTAGPVREEMPTLLIYNGAVRSYFRAQRPVIGPVHLGPSLGPLAHTSDTKTSSSLQVGVSVPVTIRRVGP